MGFFERLANAWKIFKLSFSLLSRDKSLIAVPILMVLSFFILIFILIGALGFLNFYYKTSSDNYIKYIIFLIFLFVLYLIMVFLSSAQSWMVYEVLKGKNTNVKSGFKRAIQNFGDILAFVFIIVLIRIFSSWLRGKGRVGEATGGIIDYISGIAGKLVLPAMIITEKNFKESVMQLKDSIKAIPEIATYEIGIRPLITVAVFIGIILALIFMFSFGLFIGLILFLIWICLIILISVYVNETYYTILYLALIEKKKIKNLKLF